MDDFWHEIAEMDRKMTTEMDADMDDSIDMDEGLFEDGAMDSDDMDDESGPLEL